MTDPGSRSWSRSARPESGERGAVLVEYAAVLAVVVVAALIGLADLGEVGRGVLEWQADCVASAGSLPCGPGGGGG